MGSWAKGVVSLRRMLFHELCTYFNVVVLALMVSKSYGAEEYTKPEYSDISSSGPYILPESCSQCSKDVENILRYCNKLAPECIGALVYASQHCSQCVCEVVTAGMEDDISVALCPVCPELDVCSPDTNAV